jgi:hypothetical protein
VNCKLFSCFKKSKKKITLILCGHGTWAVISWLFDNLLYPVVLAGMGYFWGGIVMTTLSCIICASTLIWYEKKGNDWVGSGTLNELRKSDLSKRNLFIKALGWALSKGDVLIFFLLTVLKDPFITTAYFTRGRFNGLNKKIWLIFGLSTLVANLYWIIRWGVIIEIFKAIFTHTVAN